MLKKLLMICLTVCLSAQTAQAKPPAFKHYVIFGDSLTDVGNYTTSSNNCIYFNAPITNHIKDFGGHYVNTTWANAGELKNVLASNEGGNNYAVAGYTTAQILTSVKSYSLNKQHLDPNTLYIIWAGTNDVLYAIGNHWADEAVKQSLIDGTNNVILALTHLYNYGARNFLVIGLMDLSQTPMSTYQNTDQALLLGIFSKKADKLRLQQACFKWNDILFLENSNYHTSSIKRFKNKHPDSHLYTWNPMPLLADMVKNPTDYGYPDQLMFNTVNSKTEDTAYPITQITYCGNTANNADHNPEHYIFYNFIHPTPSAYNIIEQAMMSNAGEFR